jgi:asparagine synthase (glutamine-hydrolysing)
MCGIAGVLGETRENRDNLLGKMGNSIAHRGPNASGIYINNRVAFVHRRLAILDLSEKANQPFISPCGNYVLLFNGEIFNYNTFYKKLEIYKIDFKTHSDTEVLLYLLIYFGLSILDELNGFFSFAFYDKINNKCWLVRDRFGVKPLFWSKDSENKIIFASEPKAIFASGFEKKIAEKNLDELFYYRHVSGENTIFSDVFRILPGHYFAIDLETNHITKTRWYNLGNSAQKVPVIQNPLKWFETTFHDAVSVRMKADVNIGTLLSGGLDSSSILYSQYLQGFKGNQTYTIKFPGYINDESSIASKVSKQFGFETHIYSFAGNKLVELLDKSILLMDEPLMHFQEPHLLGISEIATKNVTVLQSGEGADEFLGGYVRYKVHDNLIRYRILNMIRFIPQNYLKDNRLIKLKRYLYMSNVPMQLLSNANNFFLKDLEDVQFFGFNLLPEYRIEILKEAESIFPGNKLRQLMYIDQHIYLPSLNDRNDRTTMGASIECRQPFLDYRLAEGLTSLPDSYFDTAGKGKRILMESIAAKLPKYITTHRKVGLSIPWIEIINSNETLKEHKNKICQSPIFSMGSFDRIKVEKLVKEFENGNSNLGSLFLSLFFLTYWYEKQFGKY